MAQQRRSNQEWLAIFRKFENSALTQREFCRRHDISTSTLFAKRRLLECAGGNQQSGFVRAEVVE